MKFAKALMMMTVFAALLSTAAFAQEGTAAAGGDAYASLGAGLCIAIAAFGGAIGQGMAVAAALQGISRNPGAQNKIFIPMIIGLALIESLVLYAFVIAFVKIHT
jgi:F-type H+-transporting ATPase subunit c